MLKWSSFCLLLLPVLVSAQGKAWDKLPDKKLWADMKAGDRDAFFKFAAYLDSNAKTYYIFDCMECGPTRTTETTVAKEYLEFLSEECLFTGDEIWLSYKTKPAELFAFLRKHADAITYSDLLSKWLITPPEQRP